MKALRICEYCHHPIKQTSKTCPYCGAEITTIFQHVWRVISFYSGISYIWGKIKPPTKEAENKPYYREPSTVIFWFIGIVFAGYGIATQLYEVKVSRNFREVAFIQSLVETNSKKPSASIRSIKTLIDRLKETGDYQIPVKPELFPPKFILTLFGPNETDKQNLKRSKKIVSNIKAKLKDVDLSGLDLSGAYMDHAVFRDSNLQSVNFHATGLKHADFKNADITCTNFAGATLNNADFTGAKLKTCSDSKLLITKASMFSEALMQHTVLQGVDLSGVDLSGIDLSNANLTHANLNYTNLRGANLGNAILINTTLLGAKIDEHTNLKGATYLKESAALWGFNPEDRGMVPALKTEGAETR